MQLPSYEGLLIELHATLEALIRYSVNSEVRESARGRLKEINRIERNYNNTGWVVKTKDGMNAESDADAYKSKY